MSTKAKVGHPPLDRRGYIVHCFFFLHKSNYLNLHIYIPQMCEFAISAEVLACDKVLTSILVVKDFQVKQRLSESLNWQ